MNYNLKANMSKFLKEFTTNNYTHTHTRARARRHIVFSKVNDIKDVNRGLENLNYQIIN